MTDKVLDAAKASLHHPPVRILHLEDDISDHLLLEETLTGCGLMCEFVHATGQKEFESALQCFKLDLIISDFSLPGYDGMSALTTAQRMQPTTPFLFVSGTIGEERAVDSLKSGAVDYVPKENLKRLVPAVKRALRETAQQAERRQLEEQLRQAQKMEAVGQLAGGVAHDFNNLLTVIRGNVELVMLHNPALRNETRECLKQVTGAADRAANLTRQLLAFGRKQTMQAQPVNLNEITTNLTKMLKRLIGAGIEVECTFAAVRPFVQADPGMMEQILVNLVVNARDAMHSGGRLLITTSKVNIDDAHVRTHPEAKTGDFICWTVSDTGSGIAAEHLPRIFEPFFSTKEPGRGTGLGLSTVYGIVKQHNGWIEVFTQLGSGTSFRIYLPEIPEPVRAQTIEAAPAELRGGHERILVAEDEPSVRMLTRRVLETFGYQVVEAATGREVLEISEGRSGHIDLLLTGLVLPDGVTGPELAEQLRRQRPGLKVILLSGHGFDTAFRKRTLEEKSGICFLQKPCASKDLVDTVRRCLDEQNVDTISA